MLLFKYQRPDLVCLQMLKHGEVFFSSAAKLNDTNECRPNLVFKGSEKQWLGLRNLLASAILNPDSRAETANRRHARTPSKRSHHIRKVKEMACSWFNADVNTTNKIDSYLRDKLYAELVSGHFLTSFSKTILNPTMWGHYASGGKGFAIIYEATNKRLLIKHSVNKRSEIPALKTSKATIRMVRYLKRPPSVNVLDLIEDNKSANINTTKQRPRASSKRQPAPEVSKYSDWSYEKECRAFIPKRLVASIGITSGRSFQVCTSQLRGIVFGVKTEDAARKSIIESAVDLMINQKALKIIGAKQLPHYIFLFDAITPDNSYKVELKPYGAICCEVNKPVVFTSYKDMSEEATNRMRDLKEQARRSKKAGPRTGKNVWGPSTYHRSRSW